MSTSDAHLAAARTRLVHLAGLRHRTDAADRAIAAAATEERARLQEALPRLASRLHSSPAVADAYQRGVMDRGKLDMVLGQSTRHAAP